MYTIKKSWEIFNKKLKISVFIVKIFAQFDNNNSNFDKDICFSQNFPIFLPVTVYA